MGWSALVGSRGLFKPFIAADHWEKALTPKEFAAKLELIAKADRAVAKYIEAERLRLRAAQIKAEEDQKSNR